MIAFRNVALAPMRCRHTCGIVTLGRARRDCFPQCNAGGEAIE